MYNSYRSFAPNPLNFADVDLALPLSISPSLVNLCNEYPFKYLIKSCHSDKYVGTDLTLKRKPNLKQYLWHVPLPGSIHGRDSVIGLCCYAWNWENAAKVWILAQCWNIDMIFSFASSEFPKNNCVSSFKITYYRSVI